jgi:hypothetical protein
MLSELAQRFLNELRATPGRALCAKCAKVLLGLDDREVMQVIRELIDTGHVLGRRGMSLGCWGTCPRCGALQLVARLLHDRPAA